MQWKNIPDRPKVQDEVRESRGQKMKSLIFYAEEYQVYPVDDVRPMDSGERDSKASVCLLSLVSCWQLPLSSLKCSCLSVFWSPYMICYKSVLRQQKVSVLADTREAGC